MCGIAAIVKRTDVLCHNIILDRMRDEVAYRGPDDQGSILFKRYGSHWTQIAPLSPTWEVGLGHRRLSILDLSPTGHQPMVYRGNFWITYNGEVYNFIEVRAELERLGHVFRSSSDTEVILAAYAEWNTACFARFRGMWGLVILDCLRHEIILCRDRIGIKPLYLWKGAGIVAIASEIKQFRHVPGVVLRADSAAAAEYIQTGYEDPKRTLFRDIQPVPPGCWVKIPLDTLRPSVEEYWHPERVRVSVTNVEEAGRLFLDKARECIRIHLRSDVPVGCALSGGLDSSSISLLVNELRNPQGDPFHTFTVTFPNEGIDEREYVDAVLAKIQASPHFVTPDPLGFLDELDRFLWIHDEPVASFTMYAGYCLARLNGQCRVPVILSGQGGDEIFSGYWQTYFLHLRDLWKEGHLLTLLGHFMGAVMGGGNPDLISQVPLMFRRYRSRVRPKLQIRPRGTNLRNDSDVVKNVLALNGQARRLHEIRVMFLPQMLKWDDRNAMAFSIESRYPFLDHELIELCLSFAPQMLYRHGWTKYPLRVGLKNYLPKKIRYRFSKFGFETPQDKWLCGSLRPELERWLKSDRPIWEYVERKDVQRLADQVWRFHGMQDERCKDLFRAFVFDRWLDIFGIRL